MNWQGNDRVHSAPIAEIPLISTLGSPAELLVCLVEESTEVAKEGCKILRFGANDRPDYAPEAPIAIDRLNQEVADFIAVVQRLVQAGVLDVAKIEAGIPIKHARLDKYLAAKTV